MVGETSLSSETIIQTAWAKRKFAEIYYDDILDTMWKYNQTYSLASTDGKARVPQWYIMDKYGSAMTHSNNPNFKCSPFFYSVLGRAYNLVWPIRDVKAGEMCTRNFIPQIISNETMEICKVRLKAYSEKKITASSVSTPPDVIKTPEDEGDLDVELLSTKAVPKTEQPRRFCLGEYQSCVAESFVKTMHSIVVEKADNSCLFNMLSLNQTSLSVEGEMLPCGELIANKDYLQNYVKLRCGGDVPWFLYSYILPNGLVDFNKEFEKTDLTQFWMVKATDKRQLEMEPFISSQFTRIVRVCEAGPIAVSKCKNLYCLILSNIKIDRY